MMRIAHTPLWSRRGLRGRRNIQPIAALLAAAYVVLCTFGPLTHTHALADPDSALWQTAVSTAAGQSEYAPATTQSLTAPFRCAWCEWQANTVSCALAVLRIAPPPPEAPASVAVRPVHHVVFLPLPASRAPPLA